MKYDMNPLAKAGERSKRLLAELHEIVARAKSMLKEAATDEASEDAPSAKMQKGKDREETDLSWAVQRRVCLANCGPDLRRALVNERARELAALAGRTPSFVTQQDYEQAKVDVTGETDRDRQNAALDGVD